MSMLRLLMLAGLVAGCRQADPEPRPGTGLVTTLSVEPFHTLAPEPRAWAGIVFAESLSSRLARMPGLSVSVDPSDSDHRDFVLRGEVTAKDGRLVIASRLFAGGEPAPVWTSTFWRSDAPNPNLAGELAAEVAEALYGHLARRAVTANGAKP